MWLNLVKHFQYYQTTGKYHFYQRVVFNNQQTCIVLYEAIIFTIDWMKVCLFNISLSEIHILGRTYVQIKRKILVYLNFSFHI